MRPRGWSWQFNPGISAITGLFSKVNPHVIAVTEANDGFAFLAVNYGIDFDGT